MTGLTLLDRINQFIINPIIYLLMAVAFVYFIWGVVQFVGSKDDTDKVEEGKRHIIWGLLGLAIMVSAFGIIKLIINFVVSFR